MNQNKLENSITCCSCGNLFPPARILRDAHSNKFCAPCYKDMYHSAEVPLREYRPPYYFVPAPSSDPLDYPGKTWC